MSFNPIGASIDYVTIAGQRTPGIAEIQGASSPRRWDQRRGYGLSGATVIFRGLTLAQFKILLRLYTEQDWQDWESFRPIVQRPPFGERPRALDIAHPILADLNITSVVVEDLLQPAQTEDGVWTVEIRLLEYRRPTIALSRPDGSDAQQPGDEVEQRIDRNDARIRQLNQELAAP